MSCNFPVFIAIKMKSTSIFSTDQNNLADEENLIVNKKLVFLSFFSYQESWDHHYTSHC